MGWLHLLLSTQARCELVGGPGLPSAFVGWSSLAGRGPPDKQYAVPTILFMGGSRGCSEQAGMEEETLQGPYW